MRRAACTAMHRLLLVKLETPADAASPEARYQLGVLNNEASHVWPEVELHRVAPDAAFPDAGGRDVLLVDTGSTVATRRSLAAMAAAIRSGATAAVPVALASALRPDEAPPYTLRGLEAVESRLLAAPPAAGDPARLLPLSLLAASAARELAGRTDWQAGGLPAEGIARVGLYHRFTDYYGETRDDVLPFLPAGVRDVLEIGCGAGGTGRLLQERLGCRVTGVELNPAAATTAARHLHAVIGGDVAAVDLGGPYDVVVALELFEHLPEAEAVLARLASVVRPGGRIVLSVPNVGHHAVVGDLLAGRWDYLAIGLLCYTHYRFFTRRTLTDWLERLGFRDFALVAQRTELPEPFASGGFDGLAVDRESLATKGFYVLIDL